MHSCVCITTQRDSCGMRCVQLPRLTARVLEPSRKQHFAAWGNRIRLIIPDITSAEALAGSALGPRVVSRPDIFPTRAQTAHHTNNPRTIMQLKICYLPFITRSLLIRINSLPEERFLPNIQERIVVLMHANEL